MVGQLLTTITMLSNTSPHSVAEELEALRLRRSSSSIRPIYESTCMNKAPVSQRLVQGYLFGRGPGVSCRCLVWMNNSGRWRLNHLKSHLVRLRLFSLLRNSTNLRKGPGFIYRKSDIENGFNFYRMIAPCRFSTRHSLAHILTRVKTAPSLFTGRIRSRS